MVVAEHEHRIASPTRRARRAMRPGPRRPAPPTCPGSTVSSTASVTPASSTANGRALDRQRRVGHRVVVAAHVVHARAERAVRREERLRTPRRCPRSVRSPFTTTASGSSARDLGDHGAGSSPRGTAARRARRAGSGRCSLAGIAECARTRSRRSGRRWRWRSSRAARPAGAPACAPSAGSQLVGRRALDVERVLGVGLEAVDARDVVRTGRSSTSWSPTRVVTDSSGLGRERDRRPRRARR